jgi:hypothetical protein
MQENTEIKLFEEQKIRTHSAFKGVEFDTLLRCYLKPYE